MKLSGSNMYVRTCARLWQPCQSGFGLGFGLGSGMPANPEEEEMLSASPRAPASSSGETGLRTYLQHYLDLTYVWET